MTDHPGSGRLDAETIAAYLDGMLSPEERARVEAEMAADPECYEWVVNALYVSDELARAGPMPDSDTNGNGGGGGEPSRPVIPFHRRRAVQAGIGAVLATAAAILLMVRVQPSWWGWLTAPSSRFDMLVAAAGDERHIEGRLTGGFPHAPLRAVARGPNDLSNENLALLAAAGELQRAAQANPTFDTLHAWGVAQVLLGRYDAGVQTLEHALAERPEDERAMTDLAAALLARGAASGTTEDWPRAVSLSSEALARRPDLVEAAFNRALGLERLGLLNEAADAWERVVAATGDASWAAEARRHLEDVRARLQRQQGQLAFPPVDEPLDEVTRLAARDPQLAREFAEGPLLEAWASLVLDERVADASSVLDRLAAVAAVLTSRGNRSLDEEIRAIRLATPQQRHEFARAHRTFAQGLAVYEGEQPGAAVDAFQAAGEIFTRIDSPYRFWCRLHEIAARYARGEQAAAASLAQSLGDTPALAAYPEMEARLSWVKGLFSAASGRLQDALAFDERASQIYTGLGERENATFLKTLTAEALDFVGDNPHAWRQRIESMQEALPARNPRRPHSIWINSAIAAMRQGQPHLAVALQNEAVHFVDVHRQPLLAFEAYLYRARALASAGDATGARADLHEAQRYLSDVPPAIRTRMETEVLVTESLLPGTDAGRLSRAAADLFTAMGTNVRVPELLRRAAEAQMASGDADGALADLTRATEAAEALVPRSVENLRWAYADSLWPLFRLAAILQLSRGDAAAALRTAEAGALRARPLRAVEAWAAPPGQAAVRFLVGHTRSYAVLVTADGVQPVDIDADAARLDLQIRRLRQLAVARAGRDRVDAVLRALGRTWVDPWIDRVPEGSTVAIVADGALHHVPFAALRTRENQYLAERLSLQMWEALTAGDESSGRSVAEDVVLSVGLERFAGIGPSPLPDLPNARAEAERVAGQYGPSRVLLEQDATPEAVARQLPHARVVHLSTHAFANPEFANLSWIALAPDAQHPRGLWFADEIRRLSLGRTALVYLSACEGSAGQVSRAEGAASIARAFLDAGAAAVIASSQRLDDRLAAELSRIFHEHYAATGDAAQALNAAQRAMLGDQQWSDNPLGWSSVQLFTRPRQTTVASRESTS